uniref:Putative ovule protein n=1 Tax=Solanum chacoense TaxID=4108 RepID=A0A0V0GWQ5_SOLCH
MEEMHISLLGKRIAEKELFDQFIAGLGQLVTVVLHCQTMLVEHGLTVEWSVRKHVVIVFIGLQARITIQFSCPTCLQGLELLTVSQGIRGKEARDI